MQFQTQTTYTHQILEELEMNNKKSSTHLIFAAVHFSLAIVTLIPNASASKVSPLGYKALCSFSPYGAIGLVLLAGLHVFLYLRSSAKV